jgi:hypothetical protein
MAHWEYRKIDLKDLPNKIEDIDILDDAGRDGWELVAIGTNHVAYLKRQVGETSVRGRRKVAAATDNR